MPEEDISRRRFLKDISGGIAGLVLFGAIPQSAAAAPTYPYSFQKVNNEYRLFREGRQHDNRHFMSVITEDKYRSVLNFCGSTSGKDVDKISKTGITPIKGMIGIYFSEARLVLECKKIYYQDINPNYFLDLKIDKNYPNKDYHRMYVGEIVECLIR